MTKYLAYWNARNNSVQETTKNTAKPRIDKGLLPAPAKLLQEMRVPFKQSGDWLTCLCLNPAHSDNNPSMRVHTTEGHYICFACGAKGGDLISLYQLANNCTFMEAVQKLGLLTND